MDRLCIGHTEQSPQERLRKHLTKHGGFSAKAKDWKVVYQKEDNESILLQIANLLKPKVDFWDELSEKDNATILQGEADLNAGNGSLRRDVRF